MILGIPINVTAFGGDRIRAMFCPFSAVGYTILILYTICTIKLIIIISTINNV